MTKLIAALLLTFTGIAAHAQEPTRTISRVAESQEIRLSVSGNDTYMCLTAGYIGSRYVALLAECKARTTQRWALEGSGNRSDGYAIHPRSDPSSCLDLDVATVNSQNGEALIATCNSSTSQRWALVPIGSSYLLLNVGHAARYKSFNNSPAALSLRTDTSSTQAALRLFEAADEQLTKPPTQLWTSDEFSCYLQARQHAVGWETVAYGAGGYSSQSTTLKCQ